MFYSQIILQKKGPLGKVWLAAHWGDSKLKRKQVYDTDISASVDCIVHPQVPLALRVSGHLLLGVVRIYSRKVKYLMTDVSEAMVKIKLAFKEPTNPHDGGGAKGKKTSAIDLSNKPNTRSSSAGGGDNDLQHFGDYLLVDASGRATGGDAGGGGITNAFEIPFDLQAGFDDENIDAENGGGGWVPAELEDDDDEDEEGGRKKQDTLQAMMHWTQPEGDTQDSSNKPQQDADLTLNTDLSMDEQASVLRRNNQQHGQQDDEEAWTAFDPDDEEDDEDDDDNKKKKAAGDDGSVSDIEVPRAANESLLSDHQLRRASTLDGQSLQDSTGKPISPVPGGGPQQQDDDDDDMNMMPFADDSDDEQAPPPLPMDDSSDLQLSASGVAGKDANSTGGGGGASSIGGLDISTDTPHTATLQRRDEDDDQQQQQQDGEGEEAEDDSGNKRKRKSTTRRKRRKLRKVVIDNDNTELPKSHIKNMIANTDDIVQEPIHPATWIPGVTGSDRPMKTDEELLREYLGYEKLLARPALGDDGCLHPKLLNLWKRNAACVLGKPFAYKLRDTTAEDNAALGTDGDDDKTAADDVEHARQQQEGGGSVDTDERPASLNDDDDEMAPPPQQDDDDAMMPPPMDDDDEDAPPMPMDDDDDGQQQPMDDSGFAQDMDGMDKSPFGGSRESGAISLGLVNDFGEDIVEEDDDDDEGRQAPGDEAVSSHSKWHKHTVKVLRMLQHNMVSSGTITDSDKPNHLSYDTLSDGVSCRTAAGVFFELLQLKTWDFIELNQDESFGDITISPGVKFEERPPSSN